MARRHKLEIGGINIKAHPHSAEIYRDLMDLLYSLKKVVKIRGDRFGLITMVDYSDDDEDFIYGVLSTFIAIELDGDWFNAQTMGEASSNDIKAIRIPDYLHPNLKTFRFAFNVRNHELIFEHYSEGDRLTHASALSFFQSLTRDKKVLDQFGKVTCSIITEKGNVDRIFSIPRITDLSIFIEKPNSDLWGEDFEEQAEEHLSDKNARSMSVEYKAVSGQGIKRDEDLDALIRASSNNGRSVAKGYGPEGHMTVSTDRFPKVVQELYEPEVEPGLIFRRLARAFRR